MSFGREVNEACREVLTEAKQTNQEHPPVNNENMENTTFEPSYNPFQGDDYERFMGNTTLTGFGSESSSSSDDPLLSKDDGFLSNDFLSKDVELLPDSVFGDGASVFNSREAFSELLNDGWEMDMKFTPMNSDSLSQTVPPSPKKTFPTETTTTTPSTIDELEVSGVIPANTFSSREWLPDGNLGSHIDAPYNTMFKDDNRPLSVVDVTSPKYDWKADFISQLQPIPPPPSPTDVHDEVQPEVEEEEQVVDTEMPDATVEEGKKAPFPVKEDQSTKTSAKKPPKKKRKRKPREKVLPEVYEYVEPRNEDVLMGRGGKSNHHAGNKRYLEEVTNLKKWYRGIEDDKEKTDLSQCLVDYVHSYGGRFVEKNKTGWYIVPNIVARRKASQALREDTDPVKRAMKRKRFLEKKKRTEEEEEAAKKKQKKKQG